MVMNKCLVPLFQSPVDICIQVQVINGIVDCFKRWNVFVRNRNVKAILQIIDVASFIEPIQTEFFVKYGE